jgi:hypothetical protein
MAEHQAVSKLTDLGLFRGNCLKVMLEFTIPGTDGSKEQGFTNVVYVVRPTAVEDKVGYFVTFSCAPIIVGLSTCGEDFTRDDHPIRLSPEDTTMIIEGLQFDGVHWTLIGDVMNDSGDKSVDLSDITFRKIDVIIHR